MENNCIIELAAFHFQVGGWPPSPKQRMLAPAAPSGRMRQKPPGSKDRQLQVGLRFLPAQ
ncbi:hypothetical protein KNP414_07447 [Paenibacillus mucilaginosus KNP414]|uniref:Uncharacterized protein n=1 Tax=Paenibacillus mucilaginosus (strain KNP414) TaxID=1036673 RepID=F8F7E2_PAEMK|nr:hypothetical protein KNP414_07447 [Paenibacillus mucilaginosus KNP414]